MTLSNNRTIRAAAADASGDASYHPARDSGTRPAASEPAIELRGVSKHYGEQLVLQPTDLEIHDGEFFCLLGPSGCGKTTMLNLIGGFVGQTAGEIYIRGERVDGLPPNRRNVNTVFQSYALFPHMTVEENVGFGLKMARVAKSESAPRIQRALERVGLETWAERLPGQLSGGQQQRVAVARALVNEPSVLLLDEPLGALDLKFRRRLQFELAAIQRDVGTTFVYVTHDQEEAMAMGDRIAVLKHGQIEQIGSPREIYERPRSRFVADFIGESNFVPVMVRDARAGSVALLDGRPLPLVTVPAACSGHETLMVRPEAIQLTREPSSDVDLEGRVEQVVFLGGYTRTVVACDGVDVSLVVALQGQLADRGELTKGVPVFLRWDREAAVVLMDDSASRKGGTTNGIV